jgi:predicted site-specific integrase-resolvase
MLSVTEAAREAGVTHTTLYTWIKKGLKYTLITQGIRQIMKIDKSELNRFIEEQIKRGS